ncbi:MAG: methyltransferase [Chromatiaceae bacterium]|jgi:23S rRNA (guanine1835-N2)-methyltransferase
MSSQFTLDQIQLQLDRYPPEQKTRSLQAWDAADELLIRYAQQQLPHHQVPLLLVNDLFGTLACALHAWQPVQWSDSYLSQLATQHNLRQNDLTAVTQVASTEPCPAFAAVLLKLPGNHSFLRYQLRQIKQQLPDGASLIAAAKAKDIHANLLQIFAEEIGPVSASLTEKKCRLITAVCDKNQTVPKIPEFPLVWSVELPLADQTLTLDIVNHANVFAREQLDIGARFFLQHLPSVQSGQRVVDLGCGNGVIGLALLAAEPQAQILFCDESYMAVQSSRENVSRLFPAASHCEFLVDDSMSQQPDLSADYILCNPPFHQQQAVTDHIAWQMFADARRVLKIGGRLRIVCNRHLGYGEKLTRLFGGCIHVASNAKFSVFEAIRRK